MMIKRLLVLTLMFCMMLPGITTSATGTEQFIDDCTTLDLIYESNGIKGQTFHYQRQLYGMAKETRSGYVVYKVPGEIIGFSVYAMVEGNNLYIKNEDSQSFNIYVSADNSNYTHRVTAREQGGSAFGEQDKVEGGYPRRYTPTGVIPAGMHYLKIQMPTLQDGVEKAYGDYNRSIYRVVIDYATPSLEASIENCAEVTPVNQLKINFSSALNTTQITKEMFSLENAVVTGISFENGNATCVLDLEYPMLCNKNYVLSMTDDVKGENGSSLGNNKLVFKTKGTLESYSFNDDATTINKIYDSSETMIVSTTLYDTPVYGMRGASKTGYVVYKMNGNITGFNILACGAGSRKNFEHEQFYPFLWVSADGEEYTQLTAGTHYKQTYTNDSGWTQSYQKINWRLNSEGYELPYGIKYLKIQFPTAKDGVTVQNFERAIKDVQINYSAVDEAIVLNNGSQPADNEIKVSFRDGIDTSTLSTASFSVDGYSVTKVQASGDICTITLEKNLTPLTMHILNIAESLKNKQGSSISQDYRRLGFYTSCETEDYGYWRNAKIGDGGMSVGIVVHPNDPDLVYLRTDVGGIYRWDAEARYWQALTDFAPENEYTTFGGASIALDPEDKDVVYAALGSHYWQAGAVWKSTNRGTTWTKTSLQKVFKSNSNGRKGSGESLIVDPTDTDILYCGTPHDGLWISRDKAETWTQAADIPEGYPAFDQSVHNSSLKNEGVRVVSVDESTGYVYAGVHEHGVYMSTDKGYNWTLINSSPVRPSDIYAIDGVLYVSNGVGDLSTSAIGGNINKGLFKYENNTWTEITPIGIGSTRVAVTKNNAGEVVIAATGDREDDTAHRLYVKVGNASWKCVTPTSKTDDSREDISEFMPWADEYYSILSSGASAMEFTGANNGGEFWMATGKSVLHIENIFDTSVNSKFVAEVNGIELLCVTALESIPTGEAELLAGALDYGPFRILDTKDHTNTTNLSKVSGYSANGGNASMTCAIAYCESDPNYVVRASSQSNDFSNMIIATSKENGKSGTWKIGGWQTNSSYKTGAVAVSSGKNSSGVPDIVAIVKNGSNAVAKYSADFGETWNNVSGLPSGLEIGYGAMITADKKRNGKFYVYDTTGVMYVSTDGGASFSKVGNAPAASGDTRYPTVISSPDNADEILVGAGENGLFRSYDGGKTYFKFSGITQVRSVDYGKNAPDRNNSTIFVLGKINNVYGLYRSDNTEHFTIINDSSRQAIGLNPPMISADRREYGRVYVGTAGRGVLVFEPEENAPKTYIAADEQTAYVYNNKILNEKIVLYVATYDDKGTLNNISVSEPKYIDKYSKLTVDIQPPAIGESIRYFLWSKDSLTPLISLAH